MCRATYQRWQDMAIVCHFLPRCGLLAPMDSVSRPRRVTINDIASATGYAPSTVSRALSRPGRVNPATRARIEEVARSMDYVPNTQARALTSGRTETIAVLVS